MDTSYYFVLEPDGADHGPYRLHEIQRRVDVGLISRQASLCKTGDTAYVPLQDDRFAELLQPPRRAATGTAPVPITASEPTAKPAEAPPAELTPPAVAAMPPGFVPPVPAALPAHNLPPEFVPAPAASAFGAPSVPPPFMSPVPAHARPTVMPPMPAAPVPPMPVAAAPVPSTPSAPVPSVPSAPVPSMPSAPVPSMPSAPVAAAPLPSMPHDGTHSRSIVPPVPAQASPPPPAFVPAPPAFVPPIAPVAPSPAAASVGHAAMSMSNAPAAAEPAPAPKRAAFLPRRQSAAPQATSLPAPTPAQPTHQQPNAMHPQNNPQPFVPQQAQPFVPQQAQPFAQQQAQPFAQQQQPQAFAPHAPQAFAPTHAPQFAQQPHAPYPHQQPQLQLAAPPMLAEPGDLTAPTPMMLMAPEDLALTPAKASSGSFGGRRKQIAIAAGAVGVLGVGLAVGLGAMGAGSNSGAAKDAIVRVTTPTGAGTGFLIQGPDRYAYVATANHVVDRGDRVLIERDVGADGHTYIEAFPETEVVATDPDADIAIIRIKNVDAGRFARLPLATKPSKDERILSYGYPGSSLASKPGLVSKDGKVLSLVSFPAYDARYARVLRENAVDGLLISTDIEQGMSGGPTLNASNEVVGINVTKDRAHVGQNGAVSVVALRELMATVKPAAKRTDPKAEDVVALLEKIQTEYLLLPVDERAKVRETDFVHPGDLPSLRGLVGEVRREERNTDTSFIEKYSLSGQAALGMFFARLPGKLLETYRAPSTRGPLLRCELTNQRLTSFLGDLSATAEAPKAVDACDELAVRPLAWDMVAATLQWDGKEKTYTVNKLERMDEDGKIFRASLRISGASNLVELWLGVEQSRVRIKLFDTVGTLYAIKSPRTVPASAFQGTWSIKRPRVTDSINKDAEIESSETVSISITDDRKVSIRSVVTEVYFSAASSRGSAFRCSGKRTINTGMVQSFTGTLDNGVILAFPEKAAEEVGTDGVYCKPSHKPDRIVAVKLEGEQLTFYRTDGNAYPETVQLRKDVAAPAPVAPAAPAP